MKIEYFADASASGSLILIYGRDSGGFVLLRDAAGNLANQAAPRIAVHELPGFESVEGCRLFFSLATSDLGIRLVSPSKTFDCALGSDSWSNIEGLLKPFGKPFRAHRFQSLTYGFYSPLELLVSTDRYW